MGENAFLTHLSEYKDFRYIRGGVNGSRSQYVFDVLLMVVNYPDIIEIWPQVTDTESVVNNGYVMVSAVVQGDVSEVNLVYGVSSDSAWNNGNEQWDSIPMMSS